ncbi:Neuronal pentraxin receptor like [Actinidia chinensis var. chinensis]|uniref:Neuronal pentraxin receptor like n=1 Tax=Actinidia chinensis var. chinensis TaxID=1590841 RepID=A0A2R6RZ66_ACTCC|nr:Neuronal pentraxin receptor like [Actinidia chinensis var. chinensis]
MAEQKIRPSKAELKQKQCCSKRRFWESLSDNRLTIPTDREQLRTILYGPGRSEQGQPGAVNHALVKRSCFIHQTWEPVSLEVKDTEVRAYRTDPVQEVKFVFPVAGMKKPKTHLGGDALKPRN